MQRFNFTISTSPFQKTTDTTPKIMKHVLLSMVPLLLAAYYYFGLSAIMVTAITVLGAVFAEWLFSKNTLKDWSGVLTGVILAFTLPPGIPLWMAFIGGFVSIAMGKIIWGGLGQNPFNPAVVGRAFLQAAFPTALTTWSDPTGSYNSFRGTNLAMPFFQGQPIEGTSSATPLASMKFEGNLTPIYDLFTGNTGGCLGETSSVLLLIVGIYLMVRNVINWRIPVSILLTVVLFSGLFYLINPSEYPSPIFMLLSGGLLFGAFYMATDPVSSPLSPNGIWLYGIGIGFFVVLIRLWGGLPEGVMYAILLMNSTTPLLNRFMKIRTFGH